MQRSFSFHGSRGEAEARRGAQQRLGHRDASTELRNYAHSLPLEDQEAADTIERVVLNAGLAKNF